MTSPDTKGPLPIRFIWCAVVVLLAAGAFALIAGDDDGAPKKKVAAATTTTVRASTTTSVVVTTTAPIEFSGIGINAIPAGQGGRGVVSKCALLADTDAERARGLMGRDNLDPYIGMVFLYDKDVNASFYMANVKIPLSIAWFDAKGQLIGATDMEPCTVAEKDCPLYTSPKPFRYALETKKGDLETLKMGPGGSLDLGSPCGPGVGT